MANNEFRSTVTSKSKIAAKYAAAWTKATLGAEVLALRVNASMVAIEEATDDDIEERIAPDVTAFLAFRAEQEARAEAARKATPATKA